MQHTKVPRPSPSLSAIPTVSGLLSVLFVLCVFTHLHIYACIDFAYFCCLCKWDHMVPHLNVYSRDFFISPYWSTSLL